MISLKHCETVTIIVTELLRKHTAKVWLSFYFQEIKKDVKIKSEKREKKVCLTT